MRPLHRLSLLVLLAFGPELKAGTFFHFEQNNPALVVHPQGYEGGFGPLTLGICLDPLAPPETGDPTQAMRNVAATYNRLEGRVGNVVGNPAGRVDFESVLLHEVGHCLGMDHATLGPSELNTPDFNHPQLHFAAAFPGENGVFNTNDGADNIRGTRDDTRGDDVNRNWFVRYGNFPWSPPGTTTDRGTQSVSLDHLPLTNTFVEVSTSFGPCNGGQPDSSGYYGQPPTQNAMFPMLCTGRLLRDLAPDDVATLQLARAGRDGSRAAVSDNYTPFLRVVPPGPDCDIVVRFVDDAGFALCEVSAQFLAPDIVITTAQTRFQRTVDWHFNLTDTTQGGAGTADLATELQSSTTILAPGESLVLTSTIANAGPDTARAVIASIPTPAGFEFISNQGHCVSGFPCHLGDLDTGETRQIQTTWRLAEPMGSNVAARVVTMSDSPDPLPGNNAAMQVLDVLQELADLTLALSDGGSPATPGAGIRYLASIGNAGPAVAQDVSLEVTLPAGTLLVSASGSDWDCSHPASLLVRCVRDALPVAAPQPVTIALSLPPDYAGASPLEVSATLRATTPDPASLPDNSNTSSDQTPVIIPGADFIFCAGFEIAVCVR